MNTAELAHQVGISTKTVRRWMREYSIPCQKNEYGHYVFSEEDLAHYCSIRDLIKSGIPTDEIKKKMKQPRKGTIRAMQMKNSRPVEEMVTELLQRIEQNERRIESKASDVVSYQLLQHRKELDELQKKVQQLESYIKELENDKRISITEALLEKEAPVQKPRKRKKLMGFLF